LIVIVFDELEDDELEDEEDEEPDPVELPPVVEPDPPLVAVGATPEMVMGPEQSAFTL